MLIDTLTQSVVVAFSLSIASFFPPILLFSFFVHTEKVWSHFSFLALWYSHIFSLVAPRFPSLLLLLSQSMCLCVNLSDRRGLMLSRRPAYFPFLPLSSSVTHFFSPHRFRFSPSSASLWQLSWLRVEAFLLSCSLLFLCFSFLFFLFFSQALSRGLGWLRWAWLTT